MIGRRSAKVSAALLRSLCPGPTGMTGRRIMQRDLTPVARTACNQASRASSLAFTLVPVFLVGPSLFHLPHPFPRSLHHHPGRTADGGWIVNFFSGTARRLVTRLDIIKKCPGIPPPSRPFKACNLSRARAVLTAKTVVSIRVIVQLRNYA